MKEHGSRRGDRATETMKRVLPLPLKLFCIYLSIMFVISMGLQLLYAVLVDDWTFGLRDSFVIKLLISLGLCIVGAQHIYRIFTIVSLLRKARFAVANARAYLVATFAVVAVFVSSTIVTFPQSTTRNGAIWESIQIQNLGQACVLIAIALVLMLPWWIVLRSSKKVRAFAA